MSSDSQPDDSAARDELRNASSAGPPASDSAGQSSGDAPFTRLGHYEILGRIGCGAMGDVYLGYDRSLDRRAAIKVLPDELAQEEDFVERFYAEATAAAQLNHPHIVPVYYCGRDGRHHFFAMQYVEGESLADRLNRTGRLRRAEAVSIVEQTFSGLAAAHRKRLVHRDIKPGNILLDRKRGRAMLADFGLAKALDASRAMTATGVVLGTADYISPEQGRGQPVDGRSDLYSMGVLFYQLLSGRLPFEANSVTGMVFQHVYEAPFSLAEAAPDTPAALVRIVEKLLRKSREERYQSADEALAELRRFRSERGGSSDAAAIGELEIVTAPPYTSQTLDADVGAAAGWRARIEDRLFGWLRSRAPAIVDRLASTEQQVEQSLREYARRRTECEGLVKQAESVVANLEAQARCCREAARDADRRASEAAAQEATAHQARRDEYSHQTELLESQAARQRNELDSLRLKLAHINATYRRLESQNAILQARLRAAQSRLQTVRDAKKASRWAPRRVGWRPLAVAAFVLAVAACWAISRTGWRPAGPPARSSAGLAYRANLPPLASPTLRQFEVDKAAPIRAFVLSPDGRWLATGTEKGDIKVWDSLHVEEASHFVHRGYSGKLGVRALAFSPDGRTLASGGFDPAAQGEGLIQLFDTATGQIQSSFSGRFKGVYDLAFAADGRTLIALQVEREEEAAPSPRVVAAVWDIKQGRQLYRLGPAFELARHIALRPDGRMLALQNERGDVALWDLRRRQVVRRLAHCSEASPLEFSPRGDQLACASQRGVVLVYWLDEPAARSPLQLTGHSGFARQLVFDSEAQRLAVVTDDDLYLWGLREGRALGRLHVKGLGGAEFLHDDRSLVAASGRNLLVWYHLNRLAYNDVPGPSSKSLRRGTGRFPVADVQSASSALAGRDARSSVGRPLQVRKG